MIWDISRINASVCSSVSSRFMPRRWAFSAAASNPLRRTSFRPLTGHWSGREGSLPSHPSTGAPGMAGLRRSGSNEARLRDGGLSLRITVQNACGGKRSRLLFAPLEPSALDGRHSALIPNALVRGPPVLSCTISPTSNMKSSFLTEWRTSCQTMVSGSLTRYPMNPFYIAAVACWLWPLAICHSHVERFRSLCFSLKQKAHPKVPFPC